MSAPAAVAPAPATSADQRIAGRARPAGARMELVARLTSFLLACGYATAHWAGLFAPAPTARAIAVAVIATACGAALALSASLPRLAGVPLRMLLIVLAAAVGLAAIGIRVKLLLPGGWPTLSDRINGGLSVVGSVGQWPYGGPNTWLRLTALSAAPLAASLAAALAFWPLAAGTRRTRAAHFSALALLLVLYGIAAAARPFGHNALRGLGLFVVIAAWLWLPRLRRRDALAAVAVIALAGVAGLALTGRFAAENPWIDYRNWQWTFHKERVVSFDWRQSYGPIRWSRTGRTLLLIKSKKPHFWRAQVLDRFDGFRWTTDQAPAIPPRPQDVVQPRHPGWTATAQVTVRGLRSQLVIGPGTPEALPNIDRNTAVLADGTYLVDGQIKPGDTYSIRGYVPDPSVRAMRAAPAPDGSLAPFTSLAVPDPRGRSATIIDVPMRDVIGSGSRDAARVLRESRYGDIYRLARDLAQGARTNYDVVARVDQYLTGGYLYTESPPARRFPLEAFLFRDKAGYCQQFSGAAALMLRMLGIPTRVASGFAPGTLSKDTHEYVVRDLDAHAWIEVWFQGIGWVPFDPTPSVAPAAARATAVAPLPRRTTLPRLRRDLSTLGPGPEVGKGAPSSGTGSHGLAIGAVIALIAIVAALVIGVLALFHHRRRTRERVRVIPSGDADVDHLLKLLARLGLIVEPRTTLLSLEGRLRRLGGPEAADYARMLRERRFGGNGHAPPGRDDRRRIRRLLAEGVEAGPLTRLQLALPDRQDLRPRVLKLIRPQRAR